MWLFCVALLCYCGAGIATLCYVAVLVVLRVGFFIVFRLLLVSLVVGYGIDVRCCLVVWFLVLVAWGDCFLVLCVRFHYCGLVLGCCSCCLTCEWLFDYCGFWLG